MSVMGIETEYGIHAVMPAEVEHVALSTAVVSARAPSAPTAEWLTEWAQVGRMLPNGARYYVDHAHPEYSGPEVTTALDAVTWDLAGDRIVRSDAELAGRRLGVPITIFKNTTDGKGQAWGCHENFLLPRALPLGRIVADFTAHLVSRQITQGAGRVGLGPGSEQAGFQIAQRADFIEARVGLETTIRRPIINTRDEPHAAAARWRRLHIITGDASLIPFATWLKIGQAQLVLAAIVDGLTEDLPRLADPVAAVRLFSRDPGLTAAAPCTDGVHRTALELQYGCLARAERAVEGDAPLIGDAEQVLTQWRRLLDDLAADRSRAADRVDWVAKLGLLEAVRRRDGLDWDAERLATIDLLYHDLDPARGLSFALARAGRVTDPTDPAAVTRALDSPPDDTRAWLRGRALDRFANQVVAANWDHLSVATASGPRTVALPEPRGHTRDDWATHWPAATSPDRFVELAEGLGRLAGSAKGDR